MSKKLSKNLCPEKGNMILEGNAIKAILTLAIPIVINSLFYIFVKVNFNLEFPAFGTLSL